MRALPLALAWLLAAGCAQAPPVEPAAPVGPAPATSTEFAEAPAMAAADQVRRELDALVAIQVGDWRGSGVVVSADGLVLTCSHVLHGRTPWVVVDGVRRRSVVLLDNPTGDLAILRIEGGPYVHLEFGPPPALHDPILLYGVRPDGSVRWERGQVLMAGLSFPTTGRSARDRGEVFFREALIHSAPGIEGDSGGPLLDTSGRLVGINVALGEERQITVAVPTAPIARAMPALRSLRSFRELSALCARAATAPQAAPLLLAPGTPLGPRYLAPPDSDARARAARSLRALAVGQWPRSTLDEVDLTVGSLVRHAHAVAPERGGEIARVAAQTRAEARRLPPDLRGRRVFAWTWQRVVGRLALPDPLQHPID